MATAKPYATKTPITGADVPNDRVLPFLASQQMWVIRILTDRGTEYRGKLETHDYRLCPGVNGIEHARTGRVIRKPPASANASTRPSRMSFARLHSGVTYTPLWRIRRAIRISEYCNTERTHQGKMCRGGTPMQTLPDGKKLWNEGSDSLTRRTGTTSKRRELSDQV